MNLSRALTLLGIGIAIALACSPSASNQPNTCVNAIAGPPDGSINVTCAWTGACTDNALRAAVDQLIGDAGSCTEDGQCVYLTDGGFSFNDYTEGFVNPVSVQNFESFTQTVQGLICGYQEVCDAGGQIQQITLGAPSIVPQAQTCLSCYQGQCVANQVFPDSGS